MKERPILFSGPMVRAIRAGTKTQTRRVAPIRTLNLRQFGDLLTWGVTFTKAIKGVLGSYSGGRFSELQARSIIASQFNPYGQPGDRLWVRETWNTFDPWKGVFYAADDHAFGIGEDDDPDHIPPHEVRWRPSIHMPRWASRITLEITEVRVERLLDISEADAKAEGAPSADLASGRECIFPHQGTHRWGFQLLWQSINGRESWDANPWVWVLSFKVIKGLTHV